MFKVINGESSRIVNEIVRIRNKASYELRQSLCFDIPSVNNIFSGAICGLIPNNIKCSENPRGFKTKIN